jgi:FkbM family methyltransferase
MMSNDPRDMDGKRLQKAMHLLGRNTTLRARMVNFLRECELAMAYEGSARDDIIGPIVDALHEDDDTYEKELADGTRLRFYYRTKIARDLLLSAGEHPDHVWEPQTTKLLLALASCLRGDVLVGGAYFGDQAVLLARALMDKGIKVHCFEPNHEQAGMLEQNIKLNHLNNMVINRNGLWSQSGQHMRLDGFDSFANVVTASEGEGFQTVSIDDYALAHGIQIGLIQLDIEGAEFSALQGAQRILLQNKPNIIFALHRNYVDWSQGLRATPICQLLLNLGYEIFAVRDINSHYEMPNKSVELVPLDTVYLDGPPHGFNMLAVADQNILDLSIFTKINGVSPKLLPHKAAHLHHPIGGF